ncbi:hypothetical protein HK104_009613 [Borealophlyctis nickersoniae]|nr:hypothetical protein HK104_009613 [Borealophlyctis nickersoniae]
MLPTELLLPIFAYADAKTTCTLSRTCRTWHSIFQTNDAAIYLPKLRRVSFEAAIPPLLPGETYKDIYKIHHAWEDNGRRLKRNARSAKRVNALQPKAGRSYRIAPNGTGYVVVNAESAGDVVAYTFAESLRFEPPTTSLAHTFVLGATTAESAIPRLLYRARGDRTSVKVFPSIRSNLLVTVTDTGRALFWDAGSKRKQHQITIGQSILSGQLCGDVFVALQGDGRAKGWKLRKGQYQVTENAWEAVHRVPVGTCGERLAVSESVVAWVEDAGVIVRRAADGATVGKPFSVRRRLSTGVVTIPDEVALTRTHLIAHTYVDMGIHVYSLSNLELVHCFQYGILGSFDRLHPVSGHQLRVSDCGSAAWAVMMHPYHRVTDWVQKVPKDQPSEVPAIWIWYRGSHRDGEGGDGEDEECVWMRVYG